MNTNFTDKTKNGINYRYDYNHLTTNSKIEIPSKLVTINDSNYNLIDMKNIDWNNSVLSYLKDIIMFEDYKKERYENDEGYNLLTDEEKLKYPFWRDSSIVNSSTEVLDIINYLVSRAIYLDEQVAILLQRDQLTNVNLIFVDDENIDIDENFLIKDFVFNIYPNQYTEDEEGNKISSRYIEFPIYTSPKVYEDINLMLNELTVVDQIPQNILLDTNQFVNVQMKKSQTGDSTSTETNIYFNYFNIISFNGFTPNVNTVRIQMEYSSKITEHYNMIEPVRYNITINKDQNPYEYIEINNIKYFLIDKNKYKEFNLEHNVLVKYDEISYLIEEDKFNPNITKELFETLKEHKFVYSISKDSNNENMPIISIPKDNDITIKIKPKYLGDKSKDVLDNSDINVKYLISDEINNSGISDNLFVYTNDGNKIKTSINENGELVLNFKIEINVNASDDVKDSDTYIRMFGITLDGTKYICNNNLLSNLYLHIDNINDMIREIKTDSANSKKYINEYIDTIYSFSKENNLTQHFNIFDLNIDHELNSPLNFIMDLYTAENFKTAQNKLDVNYTTNPKLYEETMLGGNELSRYQKPLGNKICVYNSTNSVDQLFNLKVKNYNKTFNYNSIVVNNISSPFSSTLNLNYEEIYDANISHVARINGNELTDFIYTDLEEIFKAIKNNNNYKDKLKYYYGKALFEYFFKEYKTLSKNNKNNVYVKEIGLIPIKSTCIKENEPDIYFINENENKNPKYFNFKVIFNIPNKISGSQPLYRGGLLKLDVKTIKTNNALLAVTYTKQVGDENKPLQFEIDKPIKLNTIYSRNNALVLSRNKKTPNYDIVLDGMERENFEGGYYISLTLKNNNITSNILNFKTIKNTDNGNYGNSELYFSGFGNNVNSVLDSNGNPTGQITDYTFNIERSFQLNKFRMQIYDDLEYYGCYLEELAAYCSLKVNKNLKIDLKDDNGQSKLSCLQTTTNNGVSENYVLSSYKLGSTDDQSEGGTLLMTIKGKEYYNNITSEYIKTIGEKRISYRKFIITDYIKELFKDEEIKLYDKGNSLLIKYKYLNINDIYESSKFTTISSVVKDEMVDKSSKDNGWNDLYSFKQYSEETDEYIIEDSAFENNEFIVGLDDSNNLCIFMPIFENLESEMYKTTDNSRILNCMFKLSLFVNKTSKHQGKLFTFVFDIENVKELTK